MGWGSCAQTLFGKHWPGWGPHSCPAPLALQCGSRSLCHCTPPPCNALSSSYYDWCPGNSPEKSLRFQVETLGFYFGSVIRKCRSHPDLCDLSVLTCRMKVWTIWCHASLWLSRLTMPASTFLLRPFQLPGMSLPRIAPHFFSHLWCLSLKILPGL